MLYHFLPNGLTWFVLTLGWKIKEGDLNKKSKVFKRATVPGMKGDWQEDSTLVLKIQVILKTMGGCWHQSALCCGLCILCVSNPRLDERQLLG